MISLLEKKNIEIFKDRKIDFIYANDLYKIISYFLSIGKNSLVRDINCVYEKKYYLSQIAEIINNLSDYNVEVIKQGSYEEHPYCGHYNNIECIKYDGLEKGIEDCYDYYK